MLQKTFPLLIACAASAHAFSYGPQYYQNQSFNHTQSSGQISFNGSELKGETHLYGQVSAEKTTFGNLTINGEATLKQCTLNDGNIYGFLTAESSTFKGPLHLFGNHAILQSSTAENITISSTEPSTLDLEHTTIKGSITFRQSKGVVISSNSHIQGPVINGTIVRGKTSQQGDK